MTRHARERQLPADYLGHTYYENWLAGLETLLMECSLVSADELHSRHASSRVDAEVADRVLRPAGVPTLLARGSPTLLAIDVVPRFARGDRVRAVNRHPTGHTREPRYLRGRNGMIQQHLGAHVYPDRSAQGSVEGHHLYSVRFEAQELWGEDAEAGNAVYADLWEDYLEPAQ
jgi:nitrile hydratase